MTDNFDDPEKMVSAVLSGAKAAEVIPLHPDPSPQDSPASDPPVEETGNRIDRAKLRAGYLPPNFPITVLGEADDVFYFLNARWQFKSIHIDKMSKGRIEALFAGHTEVLDALWPNVRKDGKANGWAYEPARRALINACSRKPIWAPDEMIRGLGGWRGDDGELIFHCGDEVFAAHGQAAGRLEQAPPGELAGYIYPALPPRAHPAAASMAVASAGVELLTTLKTWSWRRPLLDPVLMLGWIGSAFLGGALNWRSMAWITGDAATGKSTLQEMTRAVFGPRGIVGTSNVSAAAIWQKLGYNCIPIAIDELEADADDRRQQQVIVLARQAASGDVVLRGSGDQKSLEYTVRSAFLFSSIYIPSLRDQDLSRMAILELLPLPLGAARLVVDPAYYREVGRSLQRTLLSQWPRFQKTFDVYAGKMATVGHGQRAIDQFATLVTCWDMLTREGLPDAQTIGEDEEITGILDGLYPGRMAEIVEREPSWSIWLNTLIGKMLDLYRGGERKTVGQAIESALRTGSDWSAEAHASASMLAQHGMRIHQSEDGRKWLAVSTRHVGMNRLMEGEIWHSVSGGTGVWKQAADRVPGSVQGPPMRFAGPNQRCVLIPIEHFTEEE